MRKLALWTFILLSILFYAFCGVIYFYSNKNIPVRERKGAYDRANIRFLQHKIRSYKALGNFEFAFNLKTTKGKSIQISELNNKSHPVFFVIPRDYCSECAEILYLEIANALRNNACNFYLIVTSAKYEKVKNLRSFNILKNIILLTNYSSNDSFHHWVNKPYMFMEDRHGNVQYLSVINMNNLSNISMLCKE